MSRVTIAHMQLLRSLCAAQILNLSEDKSVLVQVKIIMFPPRVDRSNQLQWSVA